MKKSILLLLFLLTGTCFSVFAAYLRNHPVTLNQPNGREIHCFATGDEYYNWLHDANDFTIIQHPLTGYYVYAGLQGDSLVGTNFIVGDINPETVGLRAGLNISAKKMEEKRRSVLNMMPESTPKKMLFTKSTSILNNLVIYIRFSDQTEFVTDTLYYWKMFNSDSLSDASMKRFYQEASYNKIDIISHFYPVSDTQTILSYQDSTSRNYYLPYNQVTNPDGYKNNGEKRIREQSLLERAIEAVKSQIPPDLNLDYNNDGKVDNICFIIKGFAGGWSDLLWPHRWDFYSNDIYINGFQAHDYNLLLSAHLDENKSGVLSHEMFHTFGAPDLYRYDNKNITPVGAWDLMATNGVIPQSMCAYLKWKYVGWLNEIPEITFNGTYSLKTVWHDRQCIYKIASPNSSTEYFTLEYRNKLNYFESKIPGAGLLIYRINPSINGNGNGPDDEVYIFRPNAYNTSSEGKLESAAFPVSAGSTVFNDQSNPPCFLSDNSPGGIYIRNIKLMGDSVTFEAILPVPALPDFTASRTLIAPGCGVDFFDKSIGYEDSWYWEFEGATPSVSYEQNPTGIVYNSAGSFKVKLIVSNQYGDSSIIKQDFITVTDTQLPSIAINISDVVACTIDTIQLFGSADLCPISWNWVLTPNTYSFVDGTSADSQNPKVVFHENTYYSASLSVFNSNGSRTLTQENIVSIGGTVTSGNDSIENFENMSSLSDLERKGWKFSREDQASPWDLFLTGDGQGQTKSLGVLLIKSSSETRKKSWAITPPYKLTAGDNYELSFKHSYCLRNIYTPTDSFNVYISTDCGENWTLLASYGEDGTGNFVTHADVYSSYIPTTEADWCQNNCIKLDISEYSGKESVKFKLETVRYSGNNFFIDEMDFKYTIGISSVKKEEKFIQLYPNPTSGIFNIRSSKPVSNAEILVFDIRGNMVYQSTFNNVQKQYDLSHLSKGIYFVKISGKDVLQWVRFIKQ